MKKILLIATGGTIASKNSEDGLTPKISSEELLSYVPKAREFCTIDAIQVLNIDSTNIQPEYWLTIVKAIKDNYADYDGFVVSHGTDTLAYSAAALSYLIQNSSKPIVLTGAQKPIDLDVTDARTNLYDSLLYASQPNAHGVVVEGELGVLAGVEDDVVAEESSYTKPEEVEEFVGRTGVDSLAISIGTSHGAYKFTAKQCTRNEHGVLVPPPLRFDILEEVGKRLPGFPIVLHGASSVAHECVSEINALGGKLPDAVGIPEEQLRKAAKMAVCKINIDSDIRLAMTAGIRRVFAEKPEAFDPREYLKVARAEVKKMVSHKIVNVLGSKGTL